MSEDPVNRLLRRGLITPEQANQIRLRTKFAQHNAKEHELRGRGVVRGRA